ncbi:hypothetical protein N9V38_04225 [Planktomarina temperata]|nr:hypothetical protein [Planktomarina temperata]
MHLGRALILIAGLSGPASADSLADMRQDLAGLLYETKRLTWPFSTACTKSE